MSIERDNRRVVKRRPIPGHALDRDPERTSTHMISADDAEYPREYRTLGNGTRRFSNVGLVHTSERRHTVIAAQSLEALTGLQKAEMDRKRDAFMDHLKNKYPQHALAIRGQQDRIRDQQPNYWSFKTRSSRHSQGSQPALADQAKLSFASAESLETMSEAELPIGFNRMNRFRQSLPLSRSTSQTKLRSPGVLFLQFGDETRRVHITHEISSMDTLHALIVHMFPQKLTMGMLKSSNTAILIKDESRNVFYELEDVRDIQDRSIIKIYRKEPLYASFPASHITNGDLRREMVYTSRESSPTRRLNSMSPASHLTSGSPPPVLQSSSPSRSRMSYSGGRPPSYAGSPVHHGERLSNLPPAAGVSPSPSAILERRDVKPDEDLAGKNMVLVKNEGLYADPYGMVHEGRLSITSTQSLAGMGDPFAYAGGLYKRGSVRSLSTYSAAALQTELEDSLYKPNAQIYSDTYGPSLGFRMPPSSPQKMADGRLVDVQQGQSPHSPYSGPPSRSSPVRQSFRKDSCSSVFMDSPVSKPRNPSSSGAPELFPGPGDRPLSGFGPPVPAKDTETRERMEAMEKQIASLTGLVQSALLRGSEGETPSEKTDATNGGTPPSAPASRSCTGTPIPAPSYPSATSTPAGQPTAITRLHMQLHLHDLQQNASDLRNQLQQLKKLQLQNQETVKTMLRRTETEISVRVTDTMRKQEDPLQRQRSLVEEERLRYLNEEELITQQLNDLEKSVEKIQKDNHRLVPVQELEEKAMVLKQLGETLTELKAHFPSLQSKMRVVLRVEVEAVKFLKEEPHRLDGLLKRCKTVTDTLAQIRRQVDESVWAPSNNLSQSPKKVASEIDFSKGLDFEVPTSPPMNLHDLTASTDTLGTPGFGQSGPQPPKSNNPSRAPEMVPAKTQTGPETPGRRSADKAVSVEAAERDWEEKRAALTQYSAKDINRLLEETQAELMKAIPDLEFATKHKQAAGSAASTPEHKPSKPQHAQKSTAKIDPNGRRGSDELTVPRYRTEKPSKSPPPPPPRRSFPSSHGLTTTRTGEVIITSKKDSSFMKKAESEELEPQKPQVKLRRTVSEVTRPASTPPIIASAIKDDDEEDRIIAELEVFQRSAGSPFIPKFRCDRLAAAVSPAPADLWPNGAALAAEGWKAAAASQPDAGTDSSRQLSVQEPASPASPTVPLPQIVLTEWVSDPPSPEAELEVASETGSHPCTNQSSNREVGMEGSPPVELTQAMAETERNLEGLGLLSSSPENQAEREENSLIQVPSGFLEQTLSAPGSSQASPVQPGGAPEGERAFLSLSKDEGNALVEEGGEKVGTLNAGEEGSCETMAYGPVVRVEDKPLIDLLKEPADPKVGSEKVSSITDEGSKAAVGFHGDVSEPKARRTNPSSERMPPTSEDPSGASKQAQREDLTGCPVSKCPTPRPRSFPGKDPNHQVSEQLTIQPPEEHFRASSRSSEHRATSGRRTLDQLADGEETKAASNTGGSPAEREQEPDLEDKTKEEMSPLGFASLSSHEICECTYQRLDSLEETIRELEMTINEINIHPSAEFLFRRELLGQQGSQDDRGLKEGLGDLEHSCWHARTMDSGQGEADAPRRSSLSGTKPPLLPKPQLPLDSPKSGGVSIPAMKMVNPASRLKQNQQGSPDKSKHIKQRMEYMRIQGQQQSAKNFTPPVLRASSNKDSAQRQNLPCLVQGGPEQKQKAVDGGRKGVGGKRLLKTPQKPSDLTVNAAATPFFFP
ncbi:SRC kinase signaling inhibitor 1 isoform X1 [Trachemys scripta elegans]|uniref:SRC kinase signaling inhibitor 1 isoform X1 n=3 Tax=Trachemys scripta elegans TaxID=31138 RepID=UPI0015516C0D|nr:SRC kinase signaling inhibitor 1 isoform X1 [Trachemys scripta elegans]